MIYQEDGWIAKVEVISEETDEKGISKVLKVIKTLRESELFGAKEPGEVFEVFRAHNAGAYAGWTLEPDNGVEAVYMKFTTEFQCPECSNPRLQRSGACMVCPVCGATTGCS